MSDVVERYRRLVETAKKYAADDLRGAPTSTFEIMVGHFADFAPELTRLTRELEELRAAANRAPDYCYDPKEWDCTHAWSDRSELTMELPLGGIMEVVTLIEGPSKWAVHAPIAWDDDGDPEDTEIKWFDSEDAAKSALLPTPPAAKEG